MAVAESSPALIAVMGATGTGKSQFINVATNSGFIVDEGLKSCTNEVMESKSIKPGGRPVVLIDTPGFDDTLESDMVILARIAAYLEKVYREGKRLHGIIYMYRISDRRITGTSRKSLNIVKTICGDDSLVNVVIATSMWNHVDEATGRSREDELRSSDEMFQPMVKKGVKMMRHLNTRESAMRIIQTVLNNTPRPLLIQEELVDQTRELTDTSAAQAVDEEVDKARRQYQKDIGELRARMEEALREDDNETRKELEEETEQIQRKMQKFENSHRNALQVFTEQIQASMSPVLTGIRPSEVGSGNIYGLPVTQNGRLYKQLPPIPTLQTDVSPATGGLSPKEFEDVCNIISRGSPIQLEDLRSRINQSLALTPGPVSAVSDSRTRSQPSPSSKRRQAEDPVMKESKNRKRARQARPSSTERDGMKREKSERSKSSSKKSKYSSWSCFKTSQFDDDDNDTAPTNGAPVSNVNTSHPTLDVQNGSNTR
ncbi:hypothetical protein QCA50_014417 [Cerrena zonata]|uniref:G domain-containing protein n=1 Tax=Cerrena zonata TaxID=2478898 RepID=A0AAW0FZ90_9APHY